jgi:hypothetical protein
MCIKLVIRTNLYYDARSEKHKIIKLKKKKNLQKFRFDVEFKEKKFQTLQKYKRLSK